MMDIGIIGGGTAGAASALFLARAGHRVTLYERVAKPEATGAGILLQPTGQAVLARLGLLDKVLARCSLLKQLRCETPSGKQVFKLRWDSIPGQFQGYGLHRGVLFEALFEALPKAGVQVCTGVEVRDLKSRAEGLEFITSSGQSLGPHQLCIIADGARSQLRDDTPIWKRVKPHTWGALWCVLEDKAGTFEGELHQVVQGTRQMVGALPSGLGPAGEIPRLSVFSSIRADAVEAWNSAGLDAWKAEILGLMPRLEELLKQVDSLDQVLFTRYQDVSMRQWHYQNIVYLGDAAHAMSPQLGQGANLALWDAMVLSDCLQQHSKVEPALAAYTAARKSHLRFYQAANRWATLWFQSDYNFLGTIRDYMMPVSLYIPGIEAAMVRTMAGINTGIGIGTQLKLPTRAAIPDRHPAR
jgi:2-polyprenyl-6-methoxyphenol hydroxylase-like FAD-dependent oxidoreductase